MPAAQTLITNGALGLFFTVSTKPMGTPKCKKSLLTAVVTNADEAIVARIVARIGAKKAALSRSSGQMRTNFVSMPARSCGGNCEMAV